MERYCQYFKENGVEYDIICWQREESGLPVPENEYYYYKEPKVGFWHKVSAYVGYKRFVLKHLRKNKYDKLVVLTTVPAVFLKGYLMRNYKGKYLFDFRDYSFEKFGPYRRIVNNLIEHSAITTISSHGFMEFLNPNRNIIMNHNIPALPVMKEAPPPLKEKQVLNVGFVGTVRYFDENCHIIEKLKNTFRYQLWYIGKPVPGCDLQGYCEEHEVTNVSFVGKYNNTQKTELYRDIDIINSIYGNDSLEVTTALPNRLYEAALLKKPIISSKGTFLGELIERYDIGLCVDVFEDDILSILDKYVDEFNPERFTAACNEFLEDVQKDEENLYRQLKQFIKPVKKKKER